MTYGLGASGSVPAKPEKPHLARLALGIVALAGERLGVDPAEGGRLATALGLAQQGAQSAKGAVDRLTDAARTRAARILPSRAVIDRPLRRTRTTLRRAERAGRATVVQGRNDALYILREGARWAQVRVVPAVVDGIVPHLVTRMMPEIRATVVPVVVDEVRARDLVIDRNTGVLGSTTTTLM